MMLRLRSVAPNRISPNLLLQLLLVCVIAVSTTLGAGNATAPRSGSSLVSPSSKPKKTTPAPVVVVPVDAVVTKENEAATLQCKGAQVIVWYQTRTQRVLTSDWTDEKGNSGKYVVVDSTLNITKVGRGDIGLYACYDALTKANYTVQLFMKPTMAKELGKSLNMAEGENMRLSCDVFGWPAPVINWVRLNPLINFVQPLTPNVTLADPRIVANGSMLTITPAIRTDYMVYACIAKNSVGFTNSTMLVRVKGRFAAVWPFIGIVIEVIILVVVIIYFEKKKAKQIAQQQALQEENEKLIKAQPATGDAKHRK